MKIKILALVLLLCVLALVFLVPKIIPHLKPAAREDVKWQDTFSKAGKDGLPENWVLKKKPGTPPAVFRVEKSGDTSFLNMKADKASASIVTRVDSINIEKTPYLKWKWKVITLPEGADGRVKAKDDQAIGIYVGSGSLLNNKSISYRWDTDTPKGAEGNAVYGGGTVKVKWFTLRNKQDGLDKWFTEKRNVAEDYKKAWGYYPKKIYLSVSCNSQYTGTSADADLEWMELVSNGEKPQGEEE